MTSETRHVTVIKQAIMAS